MLVNDDGEDCDNKWWLPTKMQGLSYSTIYFLTLFPDVIWTKTLPLQTVENVSPSLQAWERWKCLDSIVAFVFICKMGTKVWL